VICFIFFAHARADHVPLRKWNDDMNLPLHIFLQKYQREPVQRRKINEY
jgi:hypothetical protein